MLPKFSLKGDAGVDLALRPAGDVQEQPVQRAADELHIRLSRKWARLTRLRAVYPATQQLPFIIVHTIKAPSRHRQRDLKRRYGPMGPGSALGQDGPRP
ncbi:hypothetical protein GCM10010321_88470 [Streptomyces chartreusis]|nr:hypothetical protein GCM10010321_88470 [Streptomyces chartreusis]